jgi:ribosomal protein L15
VPTHQERQKCHRVGKRGFTAPKVIPITPLTAAERAAKRRNELWQATEKKEQSDLDVVSKFSSVSSKRTEKKIEKVVDSDLWIF